MKNYVRKSYQYNPEVHPQQYEELLKQGLSNEKIAYKWGLNPDTIREWRKKFPIMKEIYERAKCSS